MVAEGGEDEQEAALVQVSYCVQLVETPVSFKARLITRLPQGGMVVGRRHAGDDQPIASCAMAEKPEPKSLERSRIEKEKKILQDRKEIFNKDTLLPTEDKEDAEEKLTR